MESTVTIPLLKDHHSHPLFYSAFNHAISLNAVDDKQAAENILSQSFEQENGGLTVAHGWRSNRYHWSQNEIELMPPLAVFNVSLHSLTINRGGMNFLRSKYGDIVNQLADPIWYENNLRVVLNWFANLGPSISVHAHLRRSQLCCCFNAHINVTMLRITDRNSQGLDH